MEFKYAVALLKGDDEQIMGVFDTKEEALNAISTDTVWLYNK